MSQIGEGVYNGAVFEVKKEIPVNLVWFVTNRGRGRLNPMPRTSIPVSCLLTYLFLILALPARAADKTDDEQTLRNAATVLEAMLSSKDVPASVVAKADCILILPSVKKFAVGIGGTGGRGPMSCREGKNYSGKWSPPAMYTIGGASAGLQIGGTATDIVLLIMTS